MPSNAEATAGDERVLALFDDAGQVETPAPGVKAWLANDATNGRKPVLIKRLPLASDNGGGPTGKGRATEALALLRPADCANAPVDGRGRVSVCRPRCRAGEEFAAITGREYGNAPVAGVDTAAVDEFQGLVVGLADIGSRARLGSAWHLLNQGGQVRPGFEGGIEDLFVARAKGQQGHMVADPGPVPQDIDRRLSRPPQVAVIVHRAGHIEHDNDGFIFNRPHFGNRGRGLAPIGKVGRRGRVLGAGKTDAYKAKEQKGKGPQI